jgi:hypothetical protein
MEIMGLIWNYGDASMSLLFIKLSRYRYMYTQTSNCHSFDYSGIDSWWTTFGPRGYHPPSSQCFGTDMVYYIYLLLKLTVPK